MLEWKVEKALVKQQKEEEEKARKEAEAKELGEEIKKETTVTKEIVNPRPSSTSTKSNTSTKQENDGTFSKSDVLASSKIQGPFRPLNKSTLIFK